MTNTEHFWTGVELDTERQVAFKWTRDRVELLTTREDDNVEK